MLTVLLQAALSMSTLAYGAAGSAPCVASLPSPYAVQIPGTLGEVLIDDQCQHVYVTNSSNGRVEIFSLADGLLKAPITVGASPKGLDTSPDGQTLYVANSADGSFSLVDLTLGIETKKIFVAPNFIDDKPYSIAVANTGLVFFSTTFGGSGFGGRMMEFNPVSQVVRQRTDFWIFGTNTEKTELKASGDRSAIGIVAGDISSGPVFKYYAATNMFTSESDLMAFISLVSLDRSGAKVLVVPGTYILDASLNLVGSIPGGAAGAAVDPQGNIGYRVSGSQIQTLDLASASQTSSMPLGDTVNNANPFGGGVGRMAISRDGSLLAVISDHGLVLLRTDGRSPTAPHITKSFGAGTIALDGSTSLSFKIDNFNSALGLTGIGFTDLLPQGLEVSAPNGLSGACGGGAITAQPGSGSVTLTGASLAAQASCTFSVNVTGVTPGRKDNITGAVTSVEGGTGGTASASITVTSGPVLDKVPALQRFVLWLYGVLIVALTARRYWKRGTVAN